MTSRNARFQQWQAVLTNRTKRQRSGEFLVQGVRPITLAVENDWPITALLYNADARLSNWAEDLLRTVDTVRVEMAPELLHELGEKDDKTPELIAVVGIRPDDLSRLDVHSGFLGLAFDSADQPRERRIARAFAGRVRRPGHDRHRTRRRSLRPQGRAQQHRFAVHDSRCARAVTP